MFINLTNHPSSGWSEEQRKAAESYGEIQDIPFPLVDENASEAELLRLADKYCAQILSLGNPEDLTVHIMGEHTFCYALISKLQQEGIRCVASCTEHDTFINEKGQKVSTFHFARFREYVPPKASRRWIRFKERAASLLAYPFRRKGFYCWMALLAIWLCETSIVVFLQTNSSAAVMMGGIMASLMIILYPISRVAGLRFSIRSTIVSKLLANTIAPTTLGTLYLLTFVIHIGWATNAVLGLYTEHDAKLFGILVSSGVCLIGLLAVIFYFPDGRQVKDDHPEQVFISGISAINIKQDNWPKDYNGLNLIPLVRIFQLLRDDATKSRLVILHTDAFKDNDSYYATLKHIMGLVEPSAIPAIENRKTTEEKLKVLIREIAKREFMGDDHKIRLIEEMEIEFTRSCSYFENFEIAYSILESRVRELDDEQHQLYFNLTPGTGIIGSLITLMAIDGDRELYYYSQKPMPAELKTEEEKRAFRSELLLPVEKSKVPLQALLSQALETMQYNNK